MVDSIYRTRSLGIGAEGLPDQYADGKAARVWEYYIGCKQTRTEQYKTWISGLMKNRRCHNILDVACGTGIDSIMMVEEGFNVMSTDASDKMLKYALKERWNRRKEEVFDKWVIEEANWLNLVEDLEDVDEAAEGFDAVVCLGNSFAHLPDFEGDLSNQRTALTNFKDMVKPGGILVIDHRNYDAILDSGEVPAKNIYYSSSHITDIKCSNLYVNSRPTLVTLDYTMDLATLANESHDGTNGTPNGKNKWNAYNSTQRFRLSYYPHRLAEFTQLLTDIFGEKSKQEVYGDFKPIGEIKTPAYYIHVIQKDK